MATVYEVEHADLGKPFVMKVLIASADGTSRSVLRLQQESRALARLDHANIVSVVHAGVLTTRQPYFVMERLIGEPLSERLERESRLPPGEALRVATSLLDGLEAAHGIGIVHRDVKPANIFLQKSGGVKLLDFGIAKVRDAVDITSDGEVCGTPDFMAPEQAAGEPVDARTDVYAVGLVLFKMLAGRGPFDEITERAELLIAQRERPAPRLRHFAPEASPAVDDLVARALSKRREDRPGSAAQMATELRAIASGVWVPSGLAGSTPWTSAGSGPAAPEPAWTVDGTLIMDRDARHQRPSMNSPRVGGTPLDSAVTDLGECDRDDTDVSAFMDDEDTPPPPVPESDEMMVVRSRAGRTPAWLRQGAASVGLAAAIVLAYLGGQWVQRTMLAREGDRHAAAQPPPEGPVGSVTSDPAEAPPPASSRAAPSPLRERRDLEQDTRRVTTSHRKPSGAVPLTPRPPVGEGSDEGNAVATAPVVAATARRIELLEPVRPNEGGSGDAPSGSIEQLWGANTPISPWTDVPAGKPRRAKRFAPKPRGDGVRLPGSGL